MRNYQITEKEDASEKEAVRDPSMDQVYMDGSAIKYKKKSSAAPEGSPVNSVLRGGWRIAAAGLAGALLAGNAVGAAYASQTTSKTGSRAAGTSGDVSRKDFWWGDKDGDAGDDEEYSEKESAFEWDEEKILDRWDLDPDDFPSEEEEADPYIPDELIPYFQEAASEAITWYAGDTPPQTNLSQYSPRASAIRKAAEELAEESIQKEGEKLLEACRSASESMGTTVGQELVVSVQDGAFSRTSRIGVTLITPGLQVSAKDTAADADSVQDDAEKDRVSDDNEKETQESSSEKGSTSFVSWFLHRGKSEKAENTEDASTQEDASAGEGGNVAADQDSDAQKGSDEEQTSDSGNMTVYSPAFEYLLEAPFVYDAAGESYSARGNSSIPEPIGVYPYHESYVSQEDRTAKDEDSSGSQSYEENEEIGQEEESAEYEDSSGTDSGDKDEDNDHFDQDEDPGDKDESEEKEDSESSGRVFVPFRYNYQSQDESDFYVNKRKVVFIGDSRTVGMQIYCGGAQDEYWSAKNSMGYSWMVSTGVPNVEYLIDQNTDVVILMGVNDLGNVYNYVDYINMKAAEWKELGARTFFVSVTPVDDRRSPNAKNSRIESFNAYAQENLQDVYYIDAYSRIRNSFGSPDGIHFDGATYRKIYQTIEFSLYQGWYQQDGLWFYFNCGKPLTGWHFIDGQWQYMDGYGVRWVRDGRIGNMNYVPLPDFYMTGREVTGLSF